MVRGLLSMLVPLLADHTAGEACDQGFDSFLREEREALVGFLRNRTATEEDAQDAAQESLARLVRYRESQPQESWKALLYRIAVNIANDQSRYRQRRQTGNHVPLDQAEFVLHSDDPPMDELLIQRQELARIGAVIERLPPRCREIYLLSRIEGMKNAEIARHCAISLKAVEKHMTRAMAAVRQALGNWDREAL